MSGDAVAFRVECKLDTPCSGAFIVFEPGREAMPTGERTPPEERVAQADLRVDPGSTARVDVALTAHGKELVSGSPGGYRGEAYVALEDRGGFALGSSGPGPASFPQVRLRG
ncbi:MAG TPA: hypothetical protein VJT75_00530 [Thermoleophilaceae bacterium]|nr:hypothetical protein [Thermoleophilaceae bacterium]